MGSVILVIIGVVLVVKFGPLLLGIILNIPDMIRKRGHFDPNYNPPEMPNCDICGRKLVQGNNMGDVITTSDGIQRFFCCRQCVIKGKAKYNF